jgi:hypothetical protein
VRKRKRRKMMISISFYLDSKEEPPDIAPNLQPSQTRYMLAVPAFPISKSSNILSTKSTLQLIFFLSAATCIYLVISPDMFFPLTLIFLCLVLAECGIFQQPFQVQENQPDSPFDASFDRKAE